MRMDGLQNIFLHKLFESHWQHHPLRMMTQIIMSQSPRYLIQLLSLVVIHVL